MMILLFILSINLYSGSRYNWEHVYHKYCNTAVSVNMQYMYTLVRHFKRVLQIFYLIKFQFGWSCIILTMSGFPSPLVGHCENHSMYDFKFQVVQYKQRQIIFCFNIPFISFMVNLTWFFCEINALNEYHFILS